MKILCATGNADKFGIGQRALAPLGIELEQVVLDIDEIQGEDLVRIVEDKAQKAFAAIGKPVVVTDDGWSIAALNGFPGAYMKDVNFWFTPEDFLRLLDGCADRSITLLRQLAYCDEHETVVFTGTVRGTITTKPRGTYGSPIMKIVELEGRNGLTISETCDLHGQLMPAKNGDAAWQELGKWLRARTEV